VTVEPDPTLEVYEQRAEEWRRVRAPKVRDDTGRYVSEHRSRDLPVVDLGCGPGWHLPHLGDKAIAVDAATAMLDQVGDFAPTAPRVCADLRALPFRRHAFGGALASRSYVHVERSRVPLALADLHRSTTVGAPVELVVFGDEKGVGLEHGTFADDSFSGRRFSLWTEELLRDVVVGAGFEIEALADESSPLRTPQFAVRARRARTLADTVGPDMGVLMCGLNPSVYAADAGIGFARPGNRFWPAALAAGLVGRDRDPLHALLSHGLGMTDLVKRATTAASELSKDEYRAGLQRVTRLVEWLHPGVVCFNGLAGWRAAVDRKATPGPQDEPLAGATVYVMPSTSGLNAATPLADLVDHLQAVRDLGQSRS
jgi:TDG/mug DNA glycosylase family protein